MHDDTSENDHNLFFILQKVRDLEARVKILVYCQFSMNMTLENFLDLAI